MKYDYLLIRQLWDEGKSCSEIKKFLKCDKAVITQALQDYENYSFHESLSRRNRKGVNQYDLNGNFIKSFESAASAAREVSPNQNCNTVGSQILQVCKGNRKTAKGFIWKYGD